MTVTPATFDRPEDRGGPGPFVPTGAYRGSVEDAGYVEEEWFASGEVGGHRYTTSVFVRRPRDPARFSGTLVVEPLHAASAAPVWIYTSTYLLRSGHGWACVCSQKTALDAHVKPFDPERYRALEIWSDAPEAAQPAFGAGAVPRDPAAMVARMEAMRRVNAASTPILAQVGAALAGGTGPFADVEVRRTILAGHSQTGGVVTEYMLSGHFTERLADGGPVFDGFFPSGAPSVRFGPCDVPIVQVLSDGDVANPRRPGREGRPYRREDGDAPDDRYRLYELAGMPHMGTRYPPYDDAEMWRADPLGTSGRVPPGARMSSLPHNELFNMALHHLVQWADDGPAPPRADRIEVGDDELFARDDQGNSRGGVRCVQLDVPRATYRSTPGVGEDGMPAFGVVGIEEPLPHDVLGKLYRDHADYEERFDHRLDELIAAGWFLAEDADDLRREAAAADVP